MQAQRRPPIPPPLKEFFDLPLRAEGEMSSDLKERINALQREATHSSKDPASLLSLSDEAIECLMALIKALRDREETLLNDQDQLERERERLGGSARSQPQQGLNELRRAVQELGKEWRERAQRQQAHVHQECLSNLKASFKLVEWREADGALSIQLDEAWWEELSQYTALCCREWSKTTAAKMDAQSSALYEEHLSSQGEGAPPPHPSASAPISSAPTPLGDLEHEPPMELPSLGGLLLRDLRSNLMMVGLMAGILGGMRVLGVKNTRAYLYLLALPPLVILAWFKARGLKQREVTRARERCERALRRFAEERLTHALAQHRGRIERWVSQREKAWLKALERWWPEHMAPRLKAKEEHVADELRALKRGLSRNGDRIGRLRRLRDNLDQHLLFNLRRLQRELREALARTPGS